MSEPEWSPTLVRKFLHGLPTSAHTAVVDTDAGRGYLKALGTDAGPHTLASEWVGTKLATWLGLTTLEIAIIQVDAVVEIPFFNSAGQAVGRALPGSALITKEESGFPWSGDERELSKLANPQDIAKLVVFDTWMRNCDRYMDGRKPNLDNVFVRRNRTNRDRELIAIDQGHCFDCGREWTRRLSAIENVKDRRVYGCFPVFRKYFDRQTIRAICDRLGELPRDVVHSALQELPDDWEVSSEAKSGAEEFCLRRASYVAEELPKILFPQFEFDFDGSVANENDR